MHEDLRAALVDDARASGETARRAVAPVAIAAVTDGVLATE